MVLAVGAISQSAPTFKGHRIGESIQQFLAIEGMAEQASACASFLGAPDLQKRLQHDPTGNKKVMYTECMELGDALRSGVLSAKNQLLTGKFQDSKLIAIQITFGDNFEFLLKDFSIKLGGPQRTWSDEFQNAFSARFNVRRAFWETDAYTVLLSEPEKFGGGAVSALIQDKAAATAAERKEHKNALDR
jgi:hypothetical protein